MSRSIFRDSAIQRYRMRRDQDVLPRFIAPPLFTFLWILLGLCLLGGFLAWNARIPLYTSASGVIVQSEQAGQLQALLFAPADQQTTLRAGQPVQLQVGTTGPHLQLTVTSITPRILSPDQVRAQYHLNSTLSLVVNQPSIVAVILLKRDVVLPEYAGSLVSAKVQIGERNMLSLFTLFWTMR
jgi:hypothetical protein